MDEDFNIIMVCSDCHASHRNISKDHILREHEFRIEAVENGYNIPNPMRSMKREYES